MIFLTNACLFTLHIGVYFHGGHTHIVFDFFGNRNRDRHLFNDGGRRFDYVSVMF